MPDPDIIPSVLSEENRGRLVCDSIEGKKDTKRESIPFALNAETVASDNKIIDSSFNHKLLFKVGVCSSFRLVKLELRQDNKKRQGLSEILIMHCFICKSDVNIFEVSVNVQLRNVIE